MYSKYQSSSIPEVKQICRSVTMEQCESVAVRVLAMDSAREIETLLRDELRKTAPELVP